MTDFGYLSALKVLSETFEDGLASIATDLGPRFPLVSTGDSPVFSYRGSALPRVAQ